MRNHPVAIRLLKFLLILCAVVRVDGVIAQDVKIRDMPIFAAEESAVRDFSGKLKLNSPPEDELGRFLADIRNYDMAAHEDPDCFVISFAPTLFEGHAIRGGGAKYRIDKNDFHVLEVIRFK